MRTIAIVNQKGGCGKTTTAINLAAVFASRGFRTLLIDLDPQSHCAAGLGIPEDRIEKDIADAMLTPPDRPLDIQRLVWRVARDFDLVPSRTRLAGLEASRGGLADKPEKEQRLKRVIERLAQQRREPSGHDAPAMATGEPYQANSAYDVCLIDCPPHIGLLTYNAMAASREVLVPVETSFFSLRGATKQVNTVKSVARRLGMRLRTRLLATMHDPSIPLAKDLLGELKGRFGEQLIPVVIRWDTAVREAASFGQPVIEHAPESTGAKDHISLGEWLIEHSRIDREDLDMLEAGISSGEIDPAELPGALEPTRSGPIEVMPGVLRTPPTATTTTAIAKPAATAEMKPAPSIPGMDTGSASGEPVISRLEELAQRARALQDRLAGQREIGSGISGPRPGSSAPIARTAEPKPMSPAPAPAPTTSTPSSAGPVSSGAFDFATRPIGQTPGGAVATATRRAPVVIEAESRTVAPDSRDIAAMARTSLTRLLATTAPVKPIEVYTPETLDAETQVETQPETTIEEQVEAEAQAINEPDRLSATARADRVRASVQALYGARPTSRGVLFVQPLAVGEHVCVAGSFNAWSDATHVMMRNERLGVYELLVPMAPGRHEYRLVIDGRWTHDGFNGDTISNQFGEQNSVLHVPHAG